MTMNLQDTLKALAPTVGTALLGPLGGAAIEAIGSIFGIDKPSVHQLEHAIQQGQLTGEQVAALKELELKYQAEEQERGFRYADLTFRDKDSARRASVEGGTQKMLFWLSLVLLALTLGTEVAVVLGKAPLSADPLIVGRVLGLMDSVAMIVLGYWFGTSHSSAQKTTLLNQK